MTCLAFFSDHPSRWYDPLVAALTAHDLNLHLHPVEAEGEIEAALAGLRPLGFSGALVESAVQQARIPALVGRREPEVEASGRADALRVQWGSLTAGFLFPEAARRAMEQAGFAGARILWMGPAVPDLASVVRGMRTVHAYASTPTAGEGLLAQLPAPQRGRVVLGPQQAEALGAEVDVVVYAGGPLPMSVLQPYHGFFAFAEPPLQDAYLAVEQVVSPDYFRQVYLSRLLAWVADVDLPPDAFALG
ncbi:hypothetical protein [Oceanithermus sp.]|uniref:hypothetical protein n=1 Tax=Oceanithermus sp. TaxID=2268145 RepID=UPI0025FCB5FB|nr:hypothetical protein [Oceanithermus sp.]